MPAQYSVFAIRLQDPYWWVAIGVVMWCPERKWVRVRMVGEAERPKNISKDDYTLVELCDRTLATWQNMKKIPDHEELLNPFEDRFWDVVRGQLPNRLRLSQAFPALKDDLEEELISLFHRIVAPVVDPSDWVPDSIKS